MTPGRCRGKAHKPEHLGYAGRRVLVSRKWSNKTLSEHRQDRRTWVLEALGLTDEHPDPHRYLWKPVPAGDATIPSLPAPAPHDRRTPTLESRPRPPPSDRTRSFGNRRGGGMTDDKGPVLLRPEQAAQLLGIGRTTIYSLMRSGALRSVRVGTLRRIPPTALVEFVTRLEEEQAA